MGSLYPKASGGISLQTFEIPAEQVQIHSNSIIK